MSLESYGISKGACTHTINYLGNRQQAMKLGNSNSEWLDLKTGVPQGSLLGLLLCDIFVHDFLLELQKTVKTGEVYNYANDNTLSYLPSNLTL